MEKFDQQEVFSKFGPSNRITYCYYLECSRTCVICIDLRTEISVKLKQSFRENNILRSW